MRAAGVRQIGGAVELLELTEPRALRTDGRSGQSSPAGLASQDDGGSR